MGPGMMSIGDGKDDVVDALRAVYCQVLDIPVEEVNTNSSFMALGEARESLDKDANSAASLGRDKHKRFKVMPKDYDFKNIENVLQKYHGSGLECAEHIYPCSLMQENMYIGQRMGFSSLYQTTSVYRVPSSYTFDHIQDAWQQIVHRHQTLRTVHLRTDEDRALDYWIEYLDAVQPCHFPALNDNKEHPAGTSELIEVPVSTGLTRLRQFCQDSRITVAITLQAAWAQLLHISTVNADIAADSMPSDIGTALPGCATWVARPDDPPKVSRVGAVGELLIEGTILARGYIDESELTSAAFVRGLKWAPDRRMYRTGDLVRYDCKGQLHFVGRRDGQVKIHGQRIELGEIERQLVLEPYIQYALTIAPKSWPCANRLVAVVSPKSQASQANSTAKVSASPSCELDLFNGSWCGLISGMRNYLEEKLPAYMVPELWLVLKKIPKNSSAKLDRKRVANYLEHLNSDEYMSLVNRMAEQSLERPGVLRGSKSEIFGRSGAAIENEQHAGLDEDPFPLSPIQRLHFRVSNGQGDPFDQQTIVLKVRNPIDEDALASALQAVLGAHPMLRPRFVKNEDLV
ncbi:Nonribosomal peptide synthetase 8 [Diaporthe eres]|nr:Nonribosomal peptide synthetase 8 [Diaporthe eres]